MNILNIDKFTKKPYTVFIQTFLAYEYFLEWANKIITSDEIQLVVVDTGNQESVRQITDFPVYQTSQNIGCAGGWNFICNLGFNYYGLDQLVIGQDDSMFTTTMISSLWNSTQPDTLVGAYDRSFEFALFGISKSHWESVGLFDENFLFAGCEDNDYKHRSKLMNKKIQSLNYSANLNSSICSKILGDQLAPSNEHNASYIARKWGENYEFNNPFNDNNLSISDCPISATLHAMYNCTEFPSITEFKTAVSILP